MTRILILSTVSSYSPGEISRHTRDDPTLKIICERLDHLTNRVDGLKAEVERKDGRINEFEAELTEYKRLVDVEFADVHGRVDDIEE